MSITSNNFNKTNKGPFEVAYLEALRAVVACNEGIAGTSLNVVARILNDQNAPLESGRVELIKDGLQSGKMLSMLYPDYKSTANTPWIKDVNVLHLISADIAALGSEQDIENCAHYISRTIDTFKLSPMLAYKLA